MSFTDAAFRTEFWRQQPCFEPACLKTLPDIGPSELLALAGDDLVESRLVGPGYTLATGPMTLSALPPGSLLMINGLEQHTACLEQMLTREFGFLPRWRIDDVMASYGDRDASCGPHFDHYDVFLVQLHGTKQWRLDRGGHTDDELDPNYDIRLLRTLDTVTTFGAAPGDVLYIPPGVGHWGIAGPDSITLSVGIRNPTGVELLAEVTDFLLARDLPSDTIDDALQQPGDGITRADTRHLQQALVSILNDQSVLADCYGEYATRPREPDLVQTGHYDRQLSEVRLHHYARITWHQNDDPKALRVFANGETIHASHTVLDWLRPLTIDRRCGFDRVRTATDHRLLSVLAELGVLSSEQAGQPHE